MLGLEVRRPRRSTVQFFGAEDRFERHKGITPEGERRRIICHVRSNSAQGCAGSGCCKHWRESWFPRWALAIHRSGDSQSLANQLTRIPPFVVVPAHDLEQISI